MTIYSCEALKCETTYANDGDICGTDGKNYPNFSSFSCAQKGEYGIRVNLQVKHHGHCDIWKRNKFKIIAMVSIIFEFDFAEKTIIFLF